MKRSDLYPSKFWKGVDLVKPVTLRIASCRLETMKSGEGETDKMVVYFVDEPRGLVLNLVNWDSIVDVTGCEDTADWPGKVIELYPDKVSMGGKMTPCIRVRAPAQGSLPMARLSASGALDDGDIPFAPEFR